MFPGGEEINPARHIVLYPEKLAALTDERNETITSIEIDPGETPNDGKVDIYVCYADPSKVRCACDVYSAQFAEPSLAVDFLPCGKKEDSKTKTILISLFRSVIEVLERYDVPIPSPAPDVEPIPIDSSEEPTREAVELAPIDFRDSAATPPAETTGETKTWSHMETAMTLVAGIA